MIHVGTIRVEKETARILRVKAHVVRAGVSTYEVQYLDTEERRLLGCNHLTFKTRPWRTTAHEAIREDKRGGK